MSVVLVHLHSSGFVSGNFLRLGLRRPFLQALNLLCAIIMEPLRDRLVTSLLQASIVSSSCL